MTSASSAHKTATAADKPVHYSFNFYESILWFTIGLTMAVAAFRHRQQWKQLLAAAGLFVMFGFSDIVEMETGAWWRPWWLFVWKAVVVAGLVSILLWYRRRQNTDGNTGVANPRQTKDTDEVE